MKILYICFGDPFSEEMFYRENYLLKAHQEMGHEIYVIADTTKFSGNNIVNEPEGMYSIYGNIPLKRIKYKRYFCNMLTKKIRNYPKLYDEILNYKPDVIFLNCLQIHGLKILKKVKKEFSNIKIYSYVSTAIFNSGRNFISKFFLHKIIYGKWIRKALPYLDKIYYAIEESKDFMNNIYKVYDKLEFFPLPAKIYSEDVKVGLKRRFIEKNEISSGCVILSHSGKFDAKKKTIELLRYFKDFKMENVRLILAGEFCESIKQEAFEIIKNDKRIVYLGFLAHEDLISMLCATDMYLQPGSPSQTAQTAMCCGCPLVVSSMPANNFFIRDNGFMINTVDEMPGIFHRIEEKTIDFKTMGQASYKIAHQYFDYMESAKRLL